MRPAAAKDRPHVVFVTNICPHYRVKTFETLASNLPTVFYFFSAGDEWYWQHSHGTRAGEFQFEYLKGIQILGTRVTPSLVTKLLFGSYDVLIKCITGKFALIASYLIARLRRKPFVLWTGIWITLQTPLHRLIFPLTRHIYRNADAVVVYGEHVKRYLVAQGVKQEKIFVAHHAVDNAKYNGAVDPEALVALRQRLNIPSQSKVILYVGRLEDSKGLDYLVEAFAKQNKDCVLVFVGEGSWRDKVRALCAEAKIEERVRFCSYVPPDRTSLYYALGWLLAVPSVTTPRTREPWGLVVNEAMNQGIPVVASESVGAAAGGLVRHGFNGFIVPERDAEALAAAMGSLLRDAELRLRFSRNARSEVEQWTNERMVLGFRDAVDYVLNQQNNVR